MCILLLGIRARCGSSFSCKYFLELELAWRLLWAGFCVEGPSASEP